MNSTALASLALFSLTVMVGACDAPSAATQAAIEEVEFRTCTPPCLNSPFHGIYQWTNLFHGGSVVPVIGQKIPTPDGSGTRIAILSMTKAGFNATYSRVTDTGRWQIGPGDGVWVSPLGYTLTIGVYDASNNLIDDTHSILVEGELGSPGTYFAHYAYDLTTNWNPGPGFDQSTKTGRWHICPQNPEGDYRGNWQPAVSTYLGNAPVSQPTAGMVTFHSNASVSSFHCNESGPGKLSRHLEVFANGGASVGRFMGINAAEAAVNAIRAVASDAAGDSVSTTDFGVEYFPVHLNSSPLFDKRDPMLLGPGEQYVLEAVYNDTVGWNCKFSNIFHPNGVHRNADYDAPGEPGHIHNWGGKSPCGSNLVAHGNVAVYVIR